MRNYILILLCLFIISCNGKESEEKTQDAECCRKMTYLQFCLSKQYQFLGKKANNLDFKNKLFGEFTLKDKIQNNDSKCIVLLYLSRFYCDSCNKDIYEQVKEKFQNNSNFIPFTSSYQSLRELSIYYGDDICKTNMCLTDFEDSEYSFLVCINSNMKLEHFFVIDIGYMKDLDILIEKVFLPKASSKQ